MGMYASAALYYGYDLGGTETGWNVEGVQEYEQWWPAWLGTESLDDEDSELVERCEERLLRVVGGLTDEEPVMVSPELLVTPAEITAWHTAMTPYWQHREEARKRVGAQFTTHGHADADFSCHLLVARVDQLGVVGVACGEVKIVEWTDLDLQRIREGWDVALDDALAALELVPTTARGWLLTASYG